MRIDATLPQFSIVITCYNQREFIEAAVESALAQPHPRKEIIVVDDGSTDGSRTVLERYGDAISLVSFASNRGAIAARNEGAARAHGEYLVFLDGDDFLAPWALDVYERLVAMRHPKIILAKRFWFSGAPPRVVPVDVPGRLDFVDYEVFMAKDRTNGWSASAFVVERQAFQDVGGWTPGIFHLDLLDIFSKLGYSGRTILICSPHTAFYRLHASNSINDVPPFLKMTLRLLARERAGMYPGGRAHRFERYAWFGGMVFYWTRTAVRRGLYKDALRLAVSGAPMFLAAVIRRSSAFVRGRRPVESVELPLVRPASTARVIPHGAPKSRLTGSV